MKKLPPSVALTLAISAALGSLTPAHASSKTVSQTKIMGLYKVVLKIGPAQTMSMTSRSAAEKMMNGKNATCKMAPSHHLSAKAKYCNRHVEVHVYRSANGKVITNAKVTISLADRIRNRTIKVPIATMEGKQGKKDFHYGNNVFAQKGPYAVTVVVNKIKGVFGVRLS
jgi:hypothetical protein